MRQQQPVSKINSSWVSYSNKTVLYLKFCISLHFPTLFNIMTRKIWQNSFFVANMRNIMSQNGGKWRFLKCRNSCCYWNWLFNEVSDSHRVTVIDEYSKTVKLLIVVCGIFKWEVNRHLVKKLIHSANPKSRPVGIIILAHVVRPYVRPSSLFKSRKTQNNRKQCSLPGWLWVWPSGSLMTPVLLHLFPHKLTFCTKWYIFCCSSV